MTQTIKQIKTFIEKRKIDFFYNDNQDEVTVRVPICLLSKFIALFPDDFFATGVESKLFNGLVEIEMSDLLTDLDSNIDEVFGEEIEAGVMLEDEVEIKE